MRDIRWIATLLAAVATLLALDASPAHADGAPAGTDIHVSQSLGERELTVVLRRVDVVPGPLRVDVVTHAGSPAGTLTLRLGAGVATVRLGATPGTYGATLRVDRPGTQELLLDDGSTVASIPFVVPAVVLTTAETLTYYGFAAAGLLLLGALGASLLARRAWPAHVATSGLAAALGVAVTAATLSRPVPAPAPVPRPPVTLLTSSEPAGDGVTLVRLSFTDSASGRPVDDLIVHDAAFVHLLVVTPDRALRHVHPVRTRPGEYEVHLATPQPGHYTLTAEVARSGGGPQLLRSPVGFEVAGSTSATAPDTAQARVSNTAQAQVPVTISGRRAGEPTTISANFGEADLQPWLGMVGHLIAVGPLPPDAPATAVQDAQVWAHVHAMGPRPDIGAQPPDESVADLGPEVSFTHTFALPGRYQLWMQVQRNYALITVPVVLEVGAPR